MVDALRSERSELMLVEVRAASGGSQGNLPDATCCMQRSFGVAEGDQVLD